MVEQTRILRNTGAVILQDQPELALIPKPASFEREEGCFQITSETVFIADGKAESLAKVLQAALSPATGFPLPIQRSAEQNFISLALDGPETLGDEGYLLTVDPSSVELNANTPVGLFYAIQTLRQLLPSQIYRKAPIGCGEWPIPCVRIEDKPRFRWRGFMLDCGRYFQPKEFILKMIDLAAMHKLNVFHWHLTEDQGWRLQIKKYPRLTEIGAWRSESMAGHLLEYRYDGTPHGGYYTQDDAREVVAYAAERFITVVPEIELPGHCQAALAAYPELGNTGEQVPVSSMWGVHEHVFNVEEKTLQFLRDVFDEVLDIFPSRYIHIGGDEVPKTEWKNSPKAQERIQELGLKDEEELQSWFVKQIGAYLESKGRRFVGWDEILEGGLAPGAIVTSWRSEEGGIIAAESGHDVVMLPNEWTYLDHCQGDKDTEPLGFGEFLPLEKVYAYEPMPAGLDTEKAKHILGSQAQLWSEYMPNPKTVEYMAFPRLSAFSEVVWSPRSDKNYHDFLARLPAQLERLEALDTLYRPLDGACPKMTLPKGSP